MAQAGKKKLPSRRKQTVRFLVIFFCTWAALWAVPYALGTFPPGVQSLCPVTASWLGKVLIAIGFDVTVKGVLVTFGESGLSIIAECTGYTALVLFLSVVLAYPSPPLKKLVGLVIGLPIILAFNMLRLVVMALVLAHKPQYFDFAHLYFWQVALIIFVVAIVVFWIERVVGHEKTVSVSS